METPQLTPYFWAIFSWPHSLSKVQKQEPPPPYFRGEEYGGKASGLQVSFNVLIALSLAYNENKMYKTFDYWPRDMLNFDFLEKGLETVSPRYILCDLFKKMILMLYSIYWPSFILWLPLIFEILGIMYIAIVCFASDVINFEINLISLIKPLFYMTKK